MTVICGISLGVALIFALSDTSTSLPVAVSMVATLIAYVVSVVGGLTRGFTVKVKTVPADKASVKHLDRVMVDSVEVS